MRLITLCDPPTFHDETVDIIDNISSVVENYAGRRCAHVGDTEVLYLFPGAKITICLNIFPCNVDRNNHFYFSLKNERYMNNNTRYYLTEIRERVCLIT